MTGTIQEISLRDAPSRLSRRKELIHFGKLEAKCE